MTDLREQMAAVVAERDAAVDDRDRLRGELDARRSCLDGARQTLEMVSATLQNAASLSAAVVYVAGPVEERLRLIDKAIAQTDAALEEVSS